MKYKKLTALSIIAVMSITNVNLVPVYASSANSVSSVGNLTIAESIDTDIRFNFSGGTARIKAGETITASAVLTLTNAEFTSSADSALGNGTLNYSGDLENYQIDAKKLSEDSISLTITVTASEEGDARLQSYESTIHCSPTDVGTVSLAVAGDSFIKSSNSKFAKVEKGTVRIDFKGSGTSMEEVELNPITIAEDGPGAISSGQCHIYLSNGYKFTSTPIVSSSSDAVSISNLTCSGNDMFFDISSSAHSNEVDIEIRNIKVDRTDSKESGTCTITIQIPDTKDSFSAVSFQTPRSTVKGSGTTTVYAGYSTLLEDIVFTESTAGSFSKEVFTINAPEGYIFKDCTLEEMENVTGGDVDVMGGTIYIDNLKSYGDDKASFAASIRITPKNDNTSKKGSIQLEIYSNQGTSGRVNVGSVADPYTFTTGGTTMLKQFLSNQPLTDITITETKEGMFRGAELIKLYFDDESIAINNFKAEVTNGDLTIAKTYVEGGKAYIKINTSSDKASTITISDMVVSTGQTLLNGDYKLYLQNGKESYEFLIDDDYVTIDTDKYDKQHKDDIKSTITLRIDDTSYDVNGNRYYMDVPPYISEDNYTMVPVRALAEAMEIADVPYSIEWNKDLRQVVLTNDETGIRTIIPIGTASMLVGTKTYSCNSVPVIKDGRTFISVRDVTTAFGLDSKKLDWDQSSREVTVKL